MRACFHGCPSLMLHDLTALKMFRFIQGNLESHRVLVQLLQHHPLETSEIIEEIRQKADGVFL